MLIALDKDYHLIGIDVTLETNISGTEHIIDCNQSDIPDGLIRPTYDPDSKKWFDGANDDYIKHIQENEGILVHPEDVSIKLDMILDILRAQQSEQNKK